VVPILGRCPEEHHSTCLSGKHAPHMLCHCVPALCEVPAGWLALAAGAESRGGAGGWGA
jgi:hypothetical protein